MNIEKEYSKTVCIVGNAYSLLGKGLGDLIDQHDIVVRLNKCFTVNLEKDTGSKCHHWFLNNVFSACPHFHNHFFKNRLEELKEHGLKSLFFRLDPVEFFEDWQKNLNYIQGRQLLSETGRANHFQTTGVMIREEAQAIFTEIEWVDELYKRKEHTSEEKSKIFATTGLGSICYYLRRYETVNIVGFGEKEGELTLRHYWPPDVEESSKPFENDYHCLYAERDLINSLPVERLDS